MVMARAMVMAMATAKSASLQPHIQGISRQSIHSLMLTAAGSIQNGVCLSQWLCHIVPMASGDPPGLSLRTHPQSRRPSHRLCQSLSTCKVLLPAPQMRRQRLGHWRQYLCILSRLLTHSQLPHSCQLLTLHLRNPCFNHPSMM